MDDRIPLEERQFMEHTDFLGMEYPSLYICKSKRAMKREDGGKDAYKLPHRLIEKKRRDRINECIGQLKDLLPDHLKLATLGHLEKAVVLELTLKHLNALTAVTEQQHHKIAALQRGDQSMKSSIHADLDAFQSGFQACAKEVLHYLNKFENWSSREQRCTQLVCHLHAVLAQLPPAGGAPRPGPQRPPSGGAQPELDAHRADGPADAQADGQAHCVPVIQRTGELNENDTDTDSGYGGEADKHHGANAGCERAAEKAQGGHRAVKIKQEFGDDRVAKKTKMSCSVNGLVGADPSKPDLALMSSLMGLPGVGQHAPFCVPFYFINPSAAASYMPFFDKSNLDKYVYPAAAAAAAAAALTAPFPWLYPGIPGIPAGHAAAAAAAATAAACAGIPGLSAEKRANPGSFSLSRDPQSPDREAEVGSPDDREEGHESEDDEGRDDCGGGDDDDDDDEDDDDVVSDMSNETKLT